MSLGEAVGFFETIELDERDVKIAAQVLREIRARLDFLIAVGLDYLSLERAAGSLSVSADWVIYGAGVSGD